MVFCVPFILLICYLYTTKDMDTTGYVFLTGIFIVIFLLIQQVMSYADIYLAQDNLIVKKIFITRNIPMSEVKLIDQGIMPFVYYIEFKNNKRAYFQLKPKDIFNQITSSDSKNVLKLFKEKVKLQPPDESGNNSQNPRDGNKK